MTLHMSLRLAWHDNGWNGHICKKPCENVYCVGSHSYPGDLIAGSRKLEYDIEHAGEACNCIPIPPACSLSVNAFGKDSVVARVEPPVWWLNNYGKDAAKGINIELPPATACTWCYEWMYGEDVEARSNIGTKYDNSIRRNNAKDYFSQFEAGKSLIFYYAGYSNPFSEEDAQKYVIVGVSRVKKIDDFYYYEDARDEIKKSYAEGIVWQKPVTSMYPDEGLRIPYEKYMDKEDILQKILMNPDNRTPFKYGTREVSNDDAIEIIGRFIEIVNVLIDINDTAEDWQYRLNWLNSVLNELWDARGPYPGLTSVLQVLGLEKLISECISLTNKEDTKSFYCDVVGLINGDVNNVGKVTFDNKELKNLKREFSLRDDVEQELLLDILPRFDIAPFQIEAILDQNREDVSITSSLKEIKANPYIMFEQYCGLNEDDAIPFYKVDNGIIPAPDLGLERVLDADSPERLRALCLDELNRIASHSFGKAETILNNINRRLERMPDWMKHTYKIQNFNVDADVISKAIFIRDEEDSKYLYLQTVYDDERGIEKVLRELADRPDITLKVPINAEKFKDKLYQDDSSLLTEAKEEYEEILISQAEICMQIFTKPISVLSGAAGTGKTTVIKAIIENIERVHGVGASFLIMAPTGKATERIKRQTGKPSTTIHSFLAKNGWINNNLTMKRKGGSKHSNLNTIIIDECSMIDLNLFATLIRAINWNSVQRLILVGDPNQLPPIGRGRVFADIIDWLGKVHCDNIGILKKNIRQLVNKVQNEGTGILDLAKIFIQENQMDKGILSMHKEELFSKIQMSGEIDKDLSVYYWKDQDELNLLLKKVLVEDMEKGTGLSLDSEDVNENKLWSAALCNENGKVQPEKIQIISPYRGEYYGTDELNRFMQTNFNQYWSKKYNIDGISYFDKVIQYRNRPQSDPAYAYNLSKKQTERVEVYNGEIGIVKIHGFDKKNNAYMWQNRLSKFQVQFSGSNRSQYWYNYGKNLFKDSSGKYIPEQKPADNLELAYVISVHKSQGSEFDQIYIIIPRRDSHLLSMELLYTAITRAQKHVTILIQEDIGTLANLGRLEKSAVRRINSSVFEFNPLPEEFLYFHDWYASGRKLATLTMYLVRSKSEVIIANMLEQAEIPFLYEEPLFAADGTMYLPDFTVTFRGETYYWEHVGMMDKPDYKEHWKKKEDWYNKFFTGKLLVTYESDNLSHDAKRIIDEHK